MRNGKGKKKTTTSVLTSVIAIILGLIYYFFGTAAEPAPENPTPQVSVEQPAPQEPVELPASTSVMLVDPAQLPAYPQLHAGRSDHRIL